MRFSSAPRSRKSGSVMVLFTLMLPTLLLPLAGLAVDASIARLMQIRLQAAVDGAALGAGRLLGTGAVTQTVAGEFLAANFRTDSSAGTWNVSNLQDSIVYTPGITKRIDISATATSPLLFLRIFGIRSASIAANGSATRSDSRVEFIIDRSGSMNTDDGSGTHTNVIQDAVNETTILVKRFIEGTDELGLVVFDGSAVVGYPTAAAGGWTPAISLASTGGPNKTFYDGTTNDMVHQIGAITANSGTGMAEALSIAYIELQKAHMRDLADPSNNGVDTRLNSIVLLTDGVPSGITLFANNPAGSNANNIVTGSASGGNCANKTITSPGTPSNSMLNWFAIPGPPYSTSSGNPYGMYLLASTDPASAHTSNWWMQNGGSDAATPNPSTPYANATGKTCMAQRIRIDRKRSRYLVESTARAGANGNSPPPVRDVPGGEGEIDGRITIEVRMSGEDASAAPDEGPAFVSGADLGNRNRDAAITFYPDGTADAAEVLLRDHDGFRLALRINPTTARVRIIELARE